MLVDFSNKGLNENSIILPLLKKFEEQDKKLEEIFAKDREFQEKLKENYLDFPRQFPEDNIVIIKGNNSAEIFEKARPEVAGLFLMKIEE